MKARFDAGTDVAMIGAWDAHRGGLPDGPRASRVLVLDEHFELAGFHVAP